MSTASPISGRYKERPKPGTVVYYRHDDQFYKATVANSQAVADESCQIIHIGDEAIAEKHCLIDSKRLGRCYVPVASLYTKGRAMLDRDVKRAHKARAARIVARIKAQP